MKKYNYTNFENPEGLLQNDEFWTIVIPSLVRFEYLEKCIKSIEDQADMAYELIIHDDGSQDDTPGKIWDMRSKISTIIYNTGINFGLARSTNRMIQLAHSKYVLFMNTDAVIKKPCLKMLRDVLEKPYIGMVNVENTTNSSRMFKNRDTYFKINSGLSSGYASAIKKEAWQAVGGWDEESFTGGSDGAFIGRMAQNGYFFGICRGDGQCLVENTGAALTQEKGWRGSTSQFIHGLENAYPKLMKLDGPYTNHQLAGKRHERCVDQIHARERNAADNCYISWWDHFYQTLVRQDGTIDWDFAAKEHPNVLKWKSSIEAEEVHNL